MKKTFFFLFLLLSCQAFARVEDSILPSMEAIYQADFGNKINQKQKELIQQAIHLQPQKLRIMTYNMLYNAKDAEEKLPPKHRWKNRKARLIEYLDYAKADLIGSQELQQDQIDEIMEDIGNSYGYFGEKTRQNEGRTDTNAIFYKKNRLEILERKTIPYTDENCENAFTFCVFKDRINNKIFAVLNTKFSWSSPDRRLKEAVQLNQFAKEMTSKYPIIVLGDFNLYPFIFHTKNIFLDGDYVQQVLLGKNLYDTRLLSCFGHLGPLCTINNSRNTLEPFIGPELVGFILDRILVNDQVKVFTHAIDIAKVNSEYPSDHFPVIAEIGL